MRTVRLGEIATYVNGRAFKPDQWSDLGVPIIRIENLNDATAPFHRFQGVIDPKHEVADGDLLVSWSASLDAYIWERGPAVLNQHIFKVSEDPDVVDRRFFYFALRAAMSDIRSRVHGATMRHVTKGEFESVQVQVPSRAEQHRIAAQLTEQLAVVDRARDAAGERRSGSETLVTTTLRSLTTDLLAAWPTKPLGELAQMRPSPSASTEGDIEITAVTSGCLAPMGFDSSGLRRNWMPASAAAAGIVSQGEVLVARSNTEAFVGRAALYDGAPPAVTATDLTFRVAADPAQLDAEYLARFLAGLQLTGYWRDRSSGASSTMKKITRRQVLSVPTPAPPLIEQRRIAAELRDRLATIDAMTKAIESELKAIAALPAALLRRAFEQINDAA